MFKQSAGDYPCQLDASGQRRAAERALQQRKDLLISWDNTIRPHLQAKSRLRLWILTGKLGT